MKAKTYSIDNGSTCMVTGKYTIDHNGIVERA